MQNGIEVKPASAFHDPNAAPYSFGSPGQGAHPQAWMGQSAPPAYVPGATNNPLSAQQETNIFRALPSQRPAVPGDTYLGIGSAHSSLSSIKGTTLSILGMDIDITDFTSSDLDEPDITQGHQQLYNKSFQAFLQSTLGVNSRIEKVDLPGRDEGLTYAQWYFRVINPYLPVLHKGTFINLVYYMNSLYKHSIC